MDIRKLLINAAGCHHPLAQVLIDRLVQDLLMFELPPLFGRLDQVETVVSELAAVSVPQLVDVGAEWQELCVNTAHGVVKPAVRIRGQRAHGPLLIWHHGAGEIPVETALSGILNAGPVPATVAVVRAPNHQTHRGYASQLRTARGAVLMMSGSAAAMEALCRWWQGPVVVSGVSLGGMIAMFHALRWGSTQRERVQWAPIAGGPDLAGVVRRSAFSRLISASTRHDPRIDAVGAGITALPPELAARIVPLLGLWDQVQPLRAHLAAYRARGVRPVVCRRGHIGLAVDGSRVREHLCPLLRGC